MPARRRRHSQPAAASIISNDHSKACTTTACYSILASWPESPPSSRGAAAPCNPTSPNITVAKLQHPQTNRHFTRITPTFQQGVQAFLAPHHLSRDHHHKGAAAVARHIGGGHVQEAHKQAAKKSRAC